MIKKLACTVGKFDPFHAGHAHMFEWTRRALGDDWKICVAVSSDWAIEQNTGNRPRFGEFERLAVVQSCKYVDHAHVLNEKCAMKWLNGGAPGLFFKGIDSLDGLRLDGQRGFWEELCTCKARKIGVLFVPAGPLGEIHNAERWTKNV